MSVAGQPLSRTDGGGAAASGAKDQNARCSAVMALACDATGVAAAVAGAGQTAPSRTHSVSTSMSAGASLARPLGIAG